MIFLLRAAKIKHMESKNKNIFILDDDLLILEDYASSIEKAFPKVRIHRFSSPEKILEKLEYRPSVAMLDIYLNGDTTGVEIANKLRKVSPQTKIIFISGFTDEQVKEEFSDAIFLKKPLRMRELVSIVKNSLDL